MRKYSMWFDNYGINMLFAAIAICLCMLAVTIYDRHVNMPDRIVDALMSEMEMAFYQGQMYALEGDVRIELNENGCYEWTASPWDDGELKNVHYVPDCEK